MKRGNLYRLIIQAETSVVECIIFEMRQGDRKGRPYPIRI